MKDWDILNSPQQLPVVREIRAYRKIITVTINTRDPIREVSSQKID